MERARPVGTGLAAGAVSSTRSLSLQEGWTVVSTPPGEPPPEAGGDGGRVPGTVATALGPDDLDRHIHYDQHDWWYRCSVPRSAFGSGPNVRHRFRFDGLATLAEVWFNGEQVLTSSDMFVAHEVDVTDLVRDANELAIVFRSLDSALSTRRARPRWKTKLVEDQQLRWLRTTLLGRIPGWTPPVVPVGPWRPIWAETISTLDVESLDLKASLTGQDGVVDVVAKLRTLTGNIESARMQVGDAVFDLDVTSAGNRWAVRGRAEITRPALWWPSTHGEPALHACSLQIVTDAEATTIDCGRVGFRRLELDRAHDRIQLLVNGVAIFCRGSCWTSNDIVSLVGDQHRMRRTLTLLARAHGNMVRVGGTMVYETDDFYRACDELGLMVWQDFMFANMDYPVDDAAFAATIRAEVDQQLRRLSRHPSVVTFCGGSEVEQQAAMFGAPREIWSNEFFARTLPALVERHAPGTPYWTSSPTGGALPFHVGEGLTHYYGVGAYRRPLEDVRTAEVKFTPECLGFSNVPEPENLRKLTAGGAVPPHHPAWKRGVPRDTGPGWDFEDVRDHYLERLYGAHAVQLRSDHLDRYLALSRSVTGEVMARTFAEWRAEDSTCGGALTWFMNDLRPGAGWGVIDSDGSPKAAYFHLARAWAPCCVRLLDRGLDGLSALVVNESGDVLDGQLELLAISRGATIVDQALREIRVAARSKCTVGVEDAIGHFVDSTYSYRFGPPRHEAVIARLLRGDDVLSEDVYRPVWSTMTSATSVSARVERGTGGELTVVLATDVLLYGVRIDVRDHRATDNYFCLTPGRPRTVALAPVASSGRAFQGYVEALNLLEPARLSDPT
ncbi:MAG: glycoside hydrolase family 2 protein [Gemmatimonadales bacterium]